MPTSSKQGQRAAPVRARAARIVYPHIEAWELVRRRADAAPSSTLEADAPAVAVPAAPPPPVIGSQDGPIPVRQAAILALPVGEVQSLEWTDSHFDSDLPMPFDTAFKGNHAVQPEVTRGTMVSVFPVSGVDMEDRPAFARPRAFAKTEVAGLDESFGDRPGPAPAVREETGPSGFSTSVLPTLTAEHLNPDGERWLKALPVAVRPLITAKRHPHIVNKMARLWDRRDALGAYMDELLISTRPGRRGFAMEVLEELVDLQRALQERGRI